MGRGGSGVDVQREPRWGGRAAVDCDRGEVQGGWSSLGAGWLSAQGRGEVRCRNKGGSFLW